MRHVATVCILTLAACASGPSAGEPAVRPMPKQRIMKAGLLPSRQIPSERDGVRIEDTGAILFICANSDKHEDREVLISKCRECGEQNYFYWDSAGDGFRCFACTKPFPNDFVKCDVCSKPPRVVRTKNKPKAS
jgi:hypothetical protein